MQRSAEAIQDELVTIRNDRFVIPVKADHRGRVAGVAHGYSSSGQTAFVEPLETIDANNELQSLHESEAREIAKILYGLSAELRAQLPAIDMAAEAVAELDFINARAVFHQTFNCVIPEIQTEQYGSGELELIEARHPLLEENLRATGASVVPVSFALNDEKNAMVISGANAVLQISVGGYRRSSITGGKPLDVYFTRREYCAHARTLRSAGPGPVGRSRNGN
jgi:DNA mismatch repair protein MutS2